MLSGMNVCRFVSSIALLLFSVGISDVCAQSLPTLGHVKGKFYLVVDNSAKVFVNGLQIFDVEWNKGKVHESREIEIAPNDRVLLQLNNKGGPKGAFLAFLSTDKKHVVSFKAADCKIMLEATQKDATQRDIEALQRIAAVTKNAGQNPFPFECKSEWIWGASPHCAVVSLLRKEMFQPFTK